MRSWLALTLILASCGAAPAPDPVPEREPDRCPRLRRDCLEGFDYSDDGCPDLPTPEVSFVEGSTLDDDAIRLLNEVGYDARHLWPGAMIRLVAIGTSGADQIAIVRQTLIGAGTPPDRITEGGIAPEGELSDGVRIAVDGCAF